MCSVITLLKLLTYLPGTNKFTQNKCTINAYEMKLNLFCINTLRPEQNGWHFASDIFICIL